MATLYTPVSKDRQRGPSENDLKHLQYMSLIKCLPPPFCLLNDLCVDCGFTGKKPYQIWHTVLLAAEFLNSVTIFSPMFWIL